MSGIIAVAAVAALVLLVVGLYSVGREGGEGTVLSTESAPVEGSALNVVVPPEEQATLVEPGVTQALPDLAGRSLDEAIEVVEETGAGYVVIGVSEGEVPLGQVVDQQPLPGTIVQAGDLVTLIVSR